MDDRLKNKEAIDTGKTARNAAIEVNNSKIRSVGKFDKFEIPDKVLHPRSLGRSRKKAKKSSNS